MTYLIIDPSAEHLGWAIMKIQNKKAVITNCGMLYASSSWPLGRRLHYLYKCLKFLVQYFQVNHIITEDFVIPKFRQSGITVIPTINNNLKMLIWELNSSTGSNIDLKEVSTTTWRKNLGISAIPSVSKNGLIKLTASGKHQKDWKVPCRQKVEQILAFKLPETLLANTSLKERVLPHDISDCLGIALAEALEQKCSPVANLEILTNSDTIHVVKIMYTLI